jgi:serine/threonine protein kinase
MIQVIITNVANAQIFACKSINIKRDDVEQDIQFITREVAALRALAGCRNIAQWTPDVAFDTRSATIYLHMEYYSDGDLAGFIRSHTTPVPKDTVSQIFCCLAMALLDCHQRGICHRDIKPENGMALC